MADATRGDGPVTQEASAPVIRAESEGVPGVPQERIPRHIAIIMDGNGRWAQKQGLPREQGHREGAKVVRTILDECSRLGIEALTLFSFSSENWKRPPDEIEAIMGLYAANLSAEIDELVRRNVRFMQIGRRKELPDEVLAVVDRATEATHACTGPTLCMAVNYGSRGEIVDATREIARKVARGELVPDDIDESTIDSHLYTAGLPDPDLLIRTAGEMRISNYLLWQISYAELFVTDSLWPDFGAEGLREAIRAFASRRRRFGGLDA